eukprot:366453-Chlamydomonas_euryale.AAC.3
MTLCVHLSANHKFGSKVLPYRSPACHRPPPPFHHPPACPIACLPVATSDGPFHHPPVCPIARLPFATSVGPFHHPPACPIARTLATPFPSDLFRVAGPTLLASPGPDSLHSPCWLQS